MKIDPSFSENYMKNNIVPYIHMITERNTNATQNNDNPNVKTIFPDVIMTSSFN